MARKRHPEGASQIECRLIRSHFSVTEAAKCRASLYCLRQPLQLSPYHRLPRLPVCMVSLSSLVPTHRSHPDQLNGAPGPFEDISVAEIKERAIQEVAISLIRSAKDQISLAQSFESAGDFKFALSAFTKALCLTQAFMDTADFKAESVLGKRGVLWKEFTEFQQVSRSPLSPHLSCSHHPSLARG